MVFPSLGCLTCKGRRIKCDVSRPTCGRCLKANRNCTWGGNDQSTILPFKCENAFAGGERRRPRKHRIEQNIQDSILLEEKPPSTSHSPSIPLETVALHYWFENFTTWPHELVNLSSSISSITPWNCAPADSSLHLAISALSLAVYGRAKRVGEALAYSYRFYSQSVTRTRQEMMELSSEKVNQLLVTTALMGSYDVRTSDPDPPI